MEAFEIDLDSECVWLDDAWLNRDDLARKIKSMIDSGDYQIARPSQALEMLTKALASARLLALRITPEMSDALNAIAQGSGRPVGALAREAISAYLASAGGGATPQPLVQQAAVAGGPADGVPTPLTTEAASVAEAAAAATLTPKQGDDAEKKWFGK